MEAGRTNICKNCAWWDRKAEDKELAPGYGPCRRYAPRIVNLEPGIDAFWPDTRSNDWCGEFTFTEDVPQNH